MTRVYERRTGLDVLDRDECLDLIRTQQVGRIAIVEGGHPLVFPVNYLVDGEDVVFRTGEGTKLHAGNGSPACFEVDVVDAEHRAGWSVMVQGRLEEVVPTDGVLFERAHALPVDPWADVPKDHLMRVVSRTITGRRLRR
ncbi:MAG TPA: pyridoxamine 5'-phosphate oxidase family protein [Acidimicrobiales bacterium]|jgi:uncharacterized protein|nr:pyridoxamine 5'-phosphate oxidase family protein [Acidimicrobiales bacterium]